ncbi:hypothetical protein H7I02_01890 [Mycolicibacterium brumae]|uniref:Tat pathway signal protein n=1 Tax=Mycolicibacterium brumae TaxID=85968 RepID=A0A2G5P5X9_9MYCO|nr:hypothetical protein [Mycolicibacterium brumae]MCV7191556.1 hypothetical protein [Mycolicibacterium brumae]PIB73667.1 hypothetical protein CQY22_016070 [Mycolicibacterium brumae]UWW09335.1 hypothetical protein L2Z93_002431 [Mycolicibacterium brumae]
MAVPADPTPARQLSRRAALIGASRVALGLAAVGLAASACGFGDSDGPDPLLAQLELARSDAGLASSAAAAAAPPLAEALTQLAADRSSHAEALTAELSRSGHAPAATTTTSATNAVSAAPPSRADVLDALKRSTESASKTAITESGYRAGLLGSIAACCAAWEAVGLPQEPQP